MWFNRSSTELPAEITFAKATLDARVPCPYPRPHRPHRRQVIVQIVNRIQNLSQQFVSSIKMT
jgi:hypothetical protein